MENNIEKSKKWTDCLESEVYERLCNCKSLKSDICCLVDAKWNFAKWQGKDKAGYTKEDALVDILDLLDCNEQDFNLTINEYNNLKL